MDDAQLKARIDQIFNDLDAYSYYELFNLTPEASYDDIRTAFHRMAMSTHPDRYQSHPDADLRRKLYAIYKRMTEGYKVLMDSQRRREYDQGLAQGQLRLVQTQRKAAGPKRAEDAIPDPQARKFFQLGQAAERQGNLKGAKMNYAFALNMNADNPVIKEHLDRVTQKLQGG